LDLSSNALEHLDFISTLSPQLQVLKLSNNNITNLCEFYHLHSLVNLEEIEFDGNPVTESLSDYKFLVLVKAIILGKLVTVNGVSINERDELLGK
jgi:centrosomal protein CEP72